MDFTDLFPAVAAPDEAAAATLRERLAGPDSPLAPIPSAQLGRIVDIAAFFAAAQASSSPTPLTRVRVLAIAGDRGIARLGVSPTPIGLSESQVSAALADAIAEGSAPLNAFAEAAGAPLVLERAIPARLATTEDALSSAEVVAALKRGAQLVDAEVDRGVDLILPVSVGHADEVEALAIIAALTHTEPVAALGFLGTDDARWTRRAEVVRDLIFRIRHDIDVPEIVLRKIASGSLVTLVGVIAQAAVRRTPLLLDSLVTAVAAYLADRIAPGTRSWLIAGQLTPEPAHLLALRSLGVTPLFALNVPLSLGTGALTALPLIRASLAML